MKLFESTDLVAGVFENYTGQKLYMDSEYYKTVFDNDKNFCYNKTIK